MGIGHGGHGLSVLVEAECGWVREPSALDCLVAARSVTRFIAANIKLEKETYVEQYILSAHLS